jgi:predicted AlkP superfamily phosphohydrolase/phosphomutase
MLTEKRPKTLFVGLDAACWPYLTPLLEAGRLPTLKRLMDGGTWGTLLSTMPALTPAAWASIATGKNPGKHGIYDMLWRRPGSYDFQPTSGSRRLGTPFWQQLSRQGIRVGVVNAPFTHPPAAINGFMVCGFGTPASATDVTYPAEAMGRIRSNYGDYSPRGRLKDLRKTSSLEELLAGEREHQKQQAAIAAGLAHDYQVDVLVINLMLLDHVNHYATEWAQVEAAMYQTDDDLDYLLRHFEPDHTLLFSDHGSRRVRGEFLLHQWLIDEGYLARSPRTPAEQAKALQNVLARQGGTGWADKAGRRLLRSALPFVDGLWSRLENRSPFARQYVEWSGALDFGRSRLFPGSTYSGNIYLNVTGREPNGVVAAEAKAPLLAELAGKLRQISDPESGQPIFSGIYTAEQLYHGPAAAYAPDLVLDGYDTPWNAKGTFPGLINRPAINRYFLEERGDTGWHSKEGIFVFAGAAFGRGPAASAQPAGQTRQVMDLPATLLYLYGLSIPDDYDGVVMAETLARGLLDGRPVTYQPGDPATLAMVDDGYSEGESAEVMEHLRSLGYVE